MESSSSSVSQHQVFINFHGDELRHNFIAHLYEILRADGINAFIDRDDGVGKDIDDLFKKIEESRIALAVFSSRFTESEWCLEELARIKERAEEGKLVVIPIFYKVMTSTVKRHEGVFGQKLMELAGERRDVALKWQHALECVTRKRGLLYDGNSNEREFIAKISKDVKTLLLKISSDEMCRVIGSQEKRPSTSSDNISSEGFILVSAEPKYDSCETSYCEGTSELYSDGVMLYAEDLEINHSEKDEHWTWLSLEDTDGKTVKVAKLKEVYWLDIKGSFGTNVLREGTTYEVVFIVKLEDSASGWDTPVKLKLYRPVGKTTVRELSLRDQPRGQWMEIIAGEFVAYPGETVFWLQEHNTTKTCKKGLWVKGAAIRPKSI